MKQFDELLAGLFGTGSCAIGTVLQTNEVLQTISMVITILGGIVTLIVLPILNWYHKAKQDGKIDKKEIEEGIDIINKGAKEIEEQLKEKKENENKK